MTTAGDYFATKPIAVRNPLHGWLKRWEARTVLRASGDLARASILDLGAGDGYYAQLALKNGAANILCLDANLRVPNDARIAHHQYDLNQRSLREDDFAGRAIIYALGLLEFLEHPLNLLNQIATALPRASRLVILYPPPTIAGHLYRAYHQLHGVRIQLLRPRDVAQALSPLVQIYADQPHPYARVETYAHE